jgi:hypothetical protein
MVCSSFLEISSQTKKKEQATKMTTKKKKNTKISVVRGNKKHK